MPLVIATLRAEESPELTARVVAALTDSTVRLLGKERPRTTVVTQYVAGAHWARGGAPAAGGFYVEAKITFGTNDADDKAAFIGEVNRRLEAMLGSPGYVHVNEIAPDSWGYAGETKSKIRSAIPEAA